MDQTCVWCSSEYETVFRVPDEIWKQVTEIDESERGVCMSCFEDEALHQGINLYWEASIRTFPTAQKEARIRELEEIEKVARNYMNYGITHHKDGCRPKDKCECGLWKLQEALSEKSDKEK